MVQLQAPYTAVVVEPHNAKRIVLRFCLLVNVCCFPAVTV